MRGRAGRCEGDKGLGRPNSHGRHAQAKLAEEQRGHAQQCLGSPCLPPPPLSDTGRPRSTPLPGRDTLLSPCSSEWEVFSFLLDMVHVDAERLESLPSQRWAFSCTLSSADSEGEAGRELS